MNDRKTSVVRFRCTSEQRSLIESSARNEGMTISEYLLWLVENDAWKRRQSVMTADEIEADGGLTTTAPHGDQ